MATNPTMTNHSANLLNALNFYHRNGTYPLDDTSVWSSIEDFNGYVEEVGSYRYPGQLVSITNGDAYSEDNDNDITFAVVRSDGSIQKVGCELIFDSTTLAEAYVTKNPNSACAGKILSVKKSDGNGYELYSVNVDKTLTRISFDVEDIPEVTWEALTGKPTSSVTDIDASVTMTKRFTADGPEGLQFDGAEVAMKSDIPTEYDATKITGTINLANLPSGALERLVVVADTEARLALTTATVQNGDVVKEEDTGTMYYVKDDTQLGGDSPENAFEVFTAGSATSVPWSGVTGTPTTLGGYGITDGVNVSQLAETYTGDGKVVTWKQGTDDNSNSYNINGKAKEAALADVATTAKNAEKLGNQDPSYYATESDMTAIEGRMDTAESDIDTLEGNMSTAQSDITNLKNGSAITQLDATKLTGVINEENLPDSVKERLTTVATDAARFLLTTENVQQGDIVKVTDTNKMYIVKDTSNLGNESGYEPIVADSASSVEWSNVQNKPTTVAQSGLTDAVEDADISTTYAAGKIVGYEQGTNDTTSTQYDINATAKKATEADQATKALDSNKLGGQDPSYYAKQTDMTTVQSQIGSSGTSGILKDIEDLKSGSAVTSIDASKIQGVLDIENIPSAAVERLYIASTAADLATLTTEDVQNGDTVKVNDSGLMYFVKDETKLADPDDYMQAFEAYTVGQASQVPWTGVTGKPTTLNGYGITDAVNVSEKVTEANAGNAGKILVLNAEGKLDADITGHVDWANINDKPTSTIEQIDAAVTAATHSNRDVLDNLTDSDGRLTYNGTGMATKPELDKVALSALKVVDVLPGDAETDQLVLEKIAG